jgi:hypothetical protein
VSGAARRRCLNLDELGLARAHQLCGNDLAERTCDALAMDVEHLARRQLGGETQRLRGREADNCAVLEQHTVEVALRPMQLRLDTALRRQLLTGLARSPPPLGPLSVTVLPVASLVTDIAWTIAIERAFNPRTVTIGREQ